MTQNSVWTTRGFDGFIEGAFGNAGQNLYVSRAGVLQRIHAYDLNKNGYFDLVFCNDHNHGEMPPAYVYHDALGETTVTELPADGARCGMLDDLNGDGYDDLVIGNLSNGLRSDLNAIIYYGSPDGFSERREQLLPAPICISISAGDFNGDGRTDLAFLCQVRHRSPERYLRLFYQTELGFEPKRYVDLEIESADQITAGDLDGDGFADLVVRSESGAIAVYWGGPNGIDLARHSPVPVDVGASEESDAEGEIVDQPGEDFDDAPPLPGVIVLDGIPHLFVPREGDSALIPIETGRQFGTPVVLGCRLAMAAAVGDVNGDGFQDLVVACREPYGDGQCSWVYWGIEAGFDDNRRTRLSSRSACDVAVGDVDGDGCDDIALCQIRTEESYTTESLVYRGSADGSFGEPVHLTSEDARRVFVTRATKEQRPQVIFVNYRSRNALGDVDSIIYFGGPDGFSPERKKDIPGFRALEAAYCDVNDDGYMDLVIGNSYANTARRTPGSYVLLNGPDGFPDAPSMTLPTDKVQGMSCADLNRDGYLDLVFASIGEPDLMFFYGTADGFDIANPQRLHMEKDGVVYDEPRWIYLADLNNNGWLDLFVPQVSADRSFVLWGGPEGFSMERSQMLSVFHSGCATAADLTGNGYLDLIVGGHEPSRQGPHDSFAYIYWNGPDGLREDRKTLLPAKAINSMAVADFNNDGTLDLYIASYHDNRERDIDSFIYWNREGRGFSSRDRTRLPTHSVSGCVASDFNGNGWTDLAIAYHRVEAEHLAYSAVWWNGPEGFSEERVTTLPTAGPHGITSVGPGNIVDRGPEEHYVSKPFKLPGGESVSEISWEAEVPPRSWVRAQLRFSDTEAGLGKSPWQGPGEGSAWFEDHAAVSAREQSGKWMQYRLALGAEEGLRTPRVTQVDVSYGAVR